MKIAINGIILDTDFICKIGDISIFTESYKFCISFSIISFNNISTVISKDLYTPCIIKEQELYNDLKNASEQKLFEFYGYYVEKMTAMRNDIIEIWSENQPKIKQFNIENY